MPGPNKATSLQDSGASIARGGAAAKKVTDRGLPGLGQSCSAGSLTSGSPASIDPAATSRGKARFSQAGQGQDGKLDVAEFTRFMRSTNPEMSEAACKQVFNQVDKDRTGRVEFDQVLSWTFAKPSKAVAPPAKPQDQPSPISRVPSEPASPTMRNGELAGDPVFGRQVSGFSAFSSRSRTTSKRKASVELRKYPEKFIMSADCGGTTSRMMLYSVSPDAAVVPKHRAPGELIKEIKYPNIMFKSLKDIVEVFLTQDSGLDAGVRPTVAVFALAGIIIDQQCRFTNLDWVVDAREMEKELGIPRVELINDFVAQGYGMLTLADDEVSPLTDAKPKSNAPIGVIGAGTGLGGCYLVPDSDGEYRCFPSEGAHGEFGPRGAGSDELQMELLKYLKIKLSCWNRISVERVVSGTGICNIYEFLAYKWPKQVDLEVHKQHLNNPKDAAIIVSNATPGSLCEQALQIFASCYGAQVGNMALFLQPYGGLYVTGGVTKKVAEWMLKDGSFMDAYNDKGRLAPICSNVPLLLVGSDDMGQRGAHLRSVRLLQMHMLEQAHFIFEAIDTNEDGYLSFMELETACMKLGEWMLSKELKRYYGDGDETKLMDFDEFCARFAPLLAELQISHDSFAEEEERPIAKEALVAPPDRGNSQKSRHELAKVLAKYDEMRHQYQVQPVFKAKLWELKASGDRARADDWEEMEYYINNHGSVLYFHKGESKTHVYCTQKALETAVIEETSNPSSHKPWTFRVCFLNPDGGVMQENEFAASSQAGRSYWMEHFAALQKGPPEA